MSALAQVARRRGVEVSGCDIDLRASADVIASGATVQEGHSADHALGTRAVIYTSAVSPNHEELVEANRIGVPTVRRAEALAEIVRGATVVGISGTHGKTTTTAMLTDALTAVDARPTGIVGGRVATWGGNAKHGGDDLFVLEADEYDKSFLALYPTIAIVNNVEADHLECYGDLESLEDAFVEFANRSERAIFSADDAGARRIASRMTVPHWTVGTADDADIGIRALTRDEHGSSCRLVFVDGTCVDIRLSVPGLHNVRNAAIAIAAVHALGKDVAGAATALEKFEGVGRRFEVVGEIGGVTVIDDYAHHPAEIRATLDAARQRYPNRRVIAVFQPHLFSRTQLFHIEFGNVLRAADVVVVTDIYPARESPIVGVTGKLVADAVGDGQLVHWIPDRTALARRLISMVEPGDVVLLLGAGDITLTAAELTHRLAQEAA